MTKKVYDLIIVGAGAAALAAALYAARYKLTTLMLGQIPGGTSGTAHEVWNYPGFDKISGMELMMKMIEQVKMNGAEFKQETVQDIKKGKKFTVKTDKETYEAKKIILATGSERKKLGIHGEKDYVGKGISYCATCDSGFYKDKIAGVVGGSDAALTAALLLARFAKKVYIIYRKDKFTKPDQTWVEQVEKEKKIEIIFNAEVSKLIGKDKIEGVEIEIEDKKEKLKLDGLFIEIGSTPNTELAQKLGIELDKGEIAVDKNMKTNVEGAFAAGDITNNPFKQISTAVGEGSIAAYSAYKELRV
ncbi:MAG: FAD-dependent oxidoreductase [Nanoarchaeota archaeon]|nr:FAD-dependent oxidoreductase [Nanoarchaeota archaeon]